MSDLERWQTRFAASDYVFGKDPNAFLKAQAPLLPSKGTCLSVADGEARNGVWLASRGLDVTSLDYSTNAQIKARKLAEERGVDINFVNANLTTWTFPEETFDVVAAIFIQFCGPEPRARIFEGMRRTLKPGGLLIIQGYRPEQLEYKTGGPSQVENLYTAEILRAAFGDFETLELREHDSVIDEGAGHGGMSALIDFVGRKPGARKKA